MFGVVTRNESEVDVSEFDVAFYEVKDVSGRAADPVAGAVNMLSCFGDNSASATDDSAATAAEDLVAVSRDGTRATREQPYFDWTHVCPTHESYRAGLLEMVEDAAAVSDDVRLDDVGFPREEYCYCDRCNRLFADSDFEDRAAWRASVVTAFVAEAAERVPGRLYLTLYPDPYPGHLYERAGLDLSALAEHVDEFVVPLYDTHYGTTYWLETIARGFESALDRPFSVELYAVDVDVDDLIHAAEVAEASAKRVLFGYDASNAAAAIRRLRADRREGQVHGGPGDRNPNDE
jgi:hypothetical protein